MAIVEVHRAAAINHETTTARVDALIFKRHIPHQGDRVSQISRLEQEAVGCTFIRLTGMLVEPAQNGLADA